MLQEEKSTERVLDLSKEAHLSLEQYCEEKAQTVTKQIIQEQLERLEKELRTAIILLQAGSLFGKENMDMSLDELENREDELRTFTKNVVEKYYHPGLEFIELREKSYIQALLQGICDGQNNCDAKVEISI